MMRRRLNAGAALFAAVLAVAAGSVTHAEAAEPAPTPSNEAPAAAAPQPQPLSKDCSTPGVALSGSVPLPNVQMAIKERRVIKILAIGSVSSAYLRSTGQAYYQVMEQLLEKTIPGVDVQIIDRGVSGELARDAAERIRTEVALTSPDLVLWQTGGPDALAQVPVEAFETTVDDALEWLKEHSVDVALVGMQYVRNLAKDVHYQAIRSALTRVAERRQVLRIGRYEAMQVIEQGRGAASGTAVNEFSVSEQGYACLSEYVVRALTSGIFMRPIKGR